MPGTKYRTQRRKKRKAPFRKDGGRKTAVSTASASAASTAATTVSATSAESTATTTTATTTTSTTPATPTATQTKLSKSPQACHLLVWFPDPSVMRMRGRGKKGLGNNYTLARARGWNLQKVLESISSRCNTNFCPQVVLATCTIVLYALPACQYS